MRLSKLKLSGFKSFVEPTVLALPSNRIGIVGPNGCGKSNVIDAVRWVMGEGSAKNLRGGAMTDVIFNGSTVRQAAEQAAVELVFTEVNVPQYPEHSEIAVKRQIGRDGQSLYFINGVRCRRKDITDLFLGTGLGPRSYAIIEQGMISRFIEAKPEDLRFFFEEAAGISKYKERRKETEERLKETRENLARLNEIRNELNNQLDKLQKQAKQAEKFREFKQQEQLLKAQLLAIRWQVLDIAVQEQQHQIQAQAHTLQQDLLALNDLELTHKQQRDSRLKAQAELEDIQNRFYLAEKEVQRLEQSIHHIADRREQLQRDLDQAEESYLAVKEQREADDEQLAALAVEIQTGQSDLETVRAAEKEAALALQQAESAWHQWEAIWEAFNQQAAEPTQRAQVERTRLQHLEQRLDQTQQRLLKLDSQGRDLDLHPLTTALEALETEIADHEAQLAVSEQLLEQHQQAINQLRESTQQLSTRLHEQTAQVHQFSGRLASLEALQEAALGKSHADVQAWLHAHRLDNLPRLVQSVQVVKGWENAVEVVLNARLQAVCITCLDDLKGALTQLPKGLVSLVENVGCEPDSLIVAFPISTIDLPTLLSKIQTTASVSLAQLLNGVYTADTVETALHFRKHLTIHESIITPEGTWLGTHWLYSCREVGEQTNVIAREQEINRLAAQLQRLDDSVIQLSHTLEQQRFTLRDHERERDQAQRIINELRQQLSQLHSQHGGKKARLENLKSQLQHLAEERHELKEQLSEDAEALENTRHNLHAALAEMEQLAEHRELLSGQREPLQNAITQQRQAWQTAQTRRHQVEVQLQGMRTDHQRLQQGIQRLQVRLEELNEQRYELQDSLESQLDPLEDLQSELETGTIERNQLADKLRQAKQTVNHLESALTDYDTQRQVLENRSNILRSALEQLRMECQANEVRQQTLEEQLAENPPPPPLEKASFVTLLAQLPDEATEPVWQAQIEALERKIQRLGSVNLAALEEFEEQSKRKIFLDGQADDLHHALNTLEEAIRSIDRETRIRFQHTIDTVNTHLQGLFPRLFGGGQAELTLKGEDALTSGVILMARPPGKRNSTIHLLSGGEKALTAIALVFAIFQLNPAPFCMLDEVDAPLDDTNVGRFCALVKAMSERVQFIFISHNKLTMEIADQLLGVTMQEAGVSRLVTVDMKMAVDMVTV